MRTCSSGYNKFFSTPTCVFWAFYFFYFLFDSIRHQFYFPNCPRVLFCCSFRWKVSSGFMHLLFLPSGFSSRGSALGLGSWRTRRPRLSWMLLMMIAMEKLAQKVRISVRMMRHSKMQISQSPKEKQSTHFCVEFSLVWFEAKWAWTPKWVLE